MDYLRNASFGGLFVVTFTVAAVFQVAFAVLGLVTAVLAPGMFNMNGAPATNPGQAMGVDLFLLAVMLAMNAMMSAAGSGLWLLVRRFLPKAKESAASVF